MSQDERLPLIKRPYDVNVSDTPNESLGLMLMGLAALFYAIQGLLIRYVTAYDGLLVSAVLFIRGGTQITLCLLVTAVIPDGRSVFANSPRLYAFLALRGFCGAICCYLLFVSISMLPLGVAYSVYYTNPMWILLFGALTLNEPVKPTIGFAAVLCVTGAVLVADPFSQEVHHLIGVSIALAASVIGAMAYTTLRSIARQVRFLATVLSLGVFTFSVGFVGGGYRYIFDSYKASGIALACSVVAFCAQCSIAKGYQYCSAGKGALVRNIEIPLAYVLGVTLLGEMPKAICLFGGLFVLAGTLIVAIESVRKENTVDAVN